MDRPKWIEDIARINEMRIRRNDMAMTDDEVRLLLAHIDELREALSEGSSCDYACYSCGILKKCKSSDTGEYPSHRATALLNRQEPPEIEESK